MPARCAFYPIQHRRCHGPGGFGSEHWAFPLVPAYQRLAWFSSDPERPDDMAFARCNRVIFTRKARSPPDVLAEYVECPAQTTSSALPVRRLPPQILKGILPPAGKIDAYPPDAVESETVAYRLIGLSCWRPHN